MVSAEGTVFNAGHQERKAEHVLIESEVRVLDARDEDEDDVCSTIDLFHGTLGLDVMRMSDLC